MTTLVLREHTDIPRVKEGKDGTNGEEVVKLREDRHCARDIAGDLLAAVRDDAWIIQRSIYSPFFPRT